MRLIALGLCCAAAGCVSGGANDGSDDDGHSSIDGGTGGGGGGGGSPEPFQARSGSRIKMRVLATPDGAKQFQGWHDTQLDVDCGFLVAADNQTRCLPTQRLLNLGYFADSSCMEPVYITVVGPGCSAPVFDSYVVVQSAQPGGCTTYRDHVFDGASLHGGGVYTKNTEGACVEGTPPPPSTYPGYTVGAEVPASMFQAGSTTIE